MTSTKIMDLHNSLVKRFNADFTITKEELVNLMISNRYKILIYQSENFSVTYYINETVTLKKHLETVSNGDASYLEWMYLACFVKVANEK